MRKFKIMCAAAALTLALLPVGCGTDDNNDNNGVNSNGVNSNGVYDGSNNNNDNIIDDAGDALENGASTIESDIDRIDGVDNGMTNNSTTSTTHGTTTTTKK